MALKQKDYQLIARAIKHRADSSERERLIVTQVAYTLATELSQHDPKFDRSKFLQACGLEV